MRWIKKTEKIISNKLRGRTNKNKDFFFFFEGRSALNLVFFYLLFGLILPKSNLLVCSRDLFTQTVKKKAKQKKMAFVREDNVVGFYFYCRVALLV